MEKCDKFVYKALKIFNSYKIVTKYFKILQNGVDIFYI